MARVQKRGFENCVNAFSVDKCEGLCYDIINNCERLVKTAVNKPSRKEKMLKNF